ncbi:polyketide cyclase [Sulfurifustis variabilis]|uniref:Polyketide cyclase n=1 Tax=Sulfurifustis variabilis TaxID=1675686 RepID=A0A1B4V7K7_9GAMM|nr:SRPBCC family protein [Sulfurifustis variabilis]BAU47334.1 polyketide cyclase [Sulfurifustis variabilis]
MLKTIAAIVVVLVAGVLAYAATRPDTFRVERTARVQAPPEKIFALISDLHRWESWSPYEKKDPAMRKTYSGAASGTGATFEWDGNGDVGKGRLSITDTSPPSRVAMRLEMLKPFEARNVVEFTIKPDGHATDVTWGMHGPMPYVSKVLSVFIDMDRMVGKDFEAGLASLKAVAEGTPPRAGS